MSDEKEKISAETERILAESKYLGNKNLKGRNARYGWTEAQLKEYMKCSKDVVYFVEKYVKIIHVDKGLVPFKMYPYQKKLIKTAVDNRYSIFKLPRQSGKTTTLVCGYLLWFALFHSEKTIGILANKGETAKEILGRLQTSYQYLPKFLQQGVVEYNKFSFVLENGSRILAAATASDAIRGYSFSCVSTKDTKVTIRNKKTGEISTVLVSDLKNTLNTAIPKVEPNDDVLWLRVSDDEFDE